MRKLSLSSGNPPEQIRPGECELEPNDAVESRKPVLMPIVRAKNGEVVARNTTGFR